MKVFVTGGTGFIGSHLVDYLSNDPLFGEIRCLVRNDRKWLADKPVEFVKGDLHSLPVLKKAVEGVDVVFHLAALTKARSMKTLERLNVDATEHLVRLSLKAGVKHIVVLSSLAATGPSFSRPVNENDPLMPISKYGKSKMQMEQRIQELDTKEARITVMRPPAVYGPRDTQIYSFFKIASFGICPVVGDGLHPKISLMYVKDVVQALIKAIAVESPGYHPYFIAGEKDYTWDEIKTTTEKALQKKVAKIPVSSKWLKNIGTVAEKAGNLFGFHPDLNREKANEMIMEWTCSTQKARKELDFKPEYTLQEGFNTTIRWYQRNHWL